MFKQLKRIADALETIAKHITAESATTTPVPSEPYPIPQKSRARTKHKGLYGVEGIRTKYDGVNTRMVIDFCEEHGIYHTNIKNHWWVERNRVGEIISGLHLTLKKQ